MYCMRWEAIQASYRMHLMKSRQILLLLNPQDLLAFARTSKWLQSILGDPDCHFVWKAVRKRIGYPAPREARYEYWWASLLFGRKICQVRRGVVIVGLRLLRSSDLR